MKKSFRFVFVLVLLAFVLAACAAKKDEKRDSLAKLPLNQVASGAINFEGKGGVNQATVRFLGCNSNRGDKFAKNGNQLVYAGFTVFPNDGSALREDEFKAFLLDNVFLMYNKKGGLTQSMPLSDNGFILSYPTDVTISKAPLGIYNFEVLFETPKDYQFFGFNVIRADRIDQTLMSCKQ